MKRSIKFFVYPIAIIMMCMFVIVGCSDDSYFGPIIIYELEMIANPEETGSVFGAGACHEGEQVAIESKPDEGYVFLEWAGDTLYVNDTYSAVTTITMPARNISLTAVFSEGSLIDVDRNVYQTVIIGSQEWMAENLRVTRYNNKEYILSVLSDTEWENTSVGAYAIYPHERGGFSEDDVEGFNTDDEMVLAYGKLYNCYAVEDSRGLCPEGWSVPSDDDWTQLVDYLASRGFPNHFPDPNGAANALKSCRQVDSPLEGCNTSKHPRWESDDTHHGFDEFGFSALLCDFRIISGGFRSIGYNSFWWSSTEDDLTRAWSHYLINNVGVVARLSLIKNHGFGVRCVRNTGQ